MPKFLENKLKAEYGANSKVPYMVMNKLGAMHGNKETPKGKRMEKQHAAKLRGEAHSYDSSRPVRKVVSRYK